MKPNFRLKWPRQICTQFILSNAFCPKRVPPMSSPSPPQSRRTDNLPSSTGSQGSLKIAWLRGYHPPPCFLQKRLQATENKGERLQKERQESSRVRKRLKGLDLGVIGRRDQRGFVEITHRRVPQIWTYVNSKRVSRPVEAGTGS